MATIGIDLEDYIDEISDYYLIKEIKRRSESSKKNTKEKLIEAFKELQAEEGKDIDPKWPKINTLLDQQKQDWVIENWNNLTI